MKCPEMLFQLKCAERIQAFFKFQRREWIGTPIRKVGDAVRLPNGYKSRILVSPMVLMDQHRYFLEETFLCF